MPLDHLRKSLIKSALVLAIFGLNFGAEALADGMPASSKQSHGSSIKKDLPAKRTTATIQQTAKNSLPKASQNALKHQGQKTGNTAPLSDYELGKYQYCGNDSDCVVAVNGCCDCANGGKEVAINKIHTDSLRARFDCLYISCNEKFADPHCGSGVVSCINHKCEYFDDLGR